MNNIVLLDLLLKSKHPEAYKRLFDEYMDNRDGWRLSDFEDMWRKSDLNEIADVSSGEFSDFCDYWYIEVFHPAASPGGSTR